MTIVDKLADDVKQPYVGEFVILYELDLTPIGGITYYFTRNTTEDGGIPTEVEFDGDTYYPREFVIEGIGYKGEGVSPRPRVSVFDADGAINDLCKTYNDLIGATVTRRRTLKKYLDGESEADPTAQFSPEVWTVSKKVSQYEMNFEFELIPLIDVEGKKIPAKVAVKDTCTYVYRRWNGSSFDYDSNFPCPYTGTSYFKRDGTSTTSDLDVCSHDLTGCKLRYSDFGPLPIFAFPGLNRFRR